MDTHTGEFLALTVPEDTIQERLNAVIQKVDDMKSKFDVIMQRTHNSYHSQSRHRHWKDCNFVSCREARAIMG